jgi:hypothetical protein
MSFRKNLCQIEHNSAPFSDELRLQLDGRHQESDCLQPVKPRIACGMLVDLGREELDSLRYPELRLPIDVRNNLIPTASWTLCFTAFFPVSIWHGQPYMNAPYASLSHHDDAKVKIAPAHSDSAQFLTAVPDGISLLTPRSLTSHLRPG